MFLLQFLILYNIYLMYSNNNLYFLLFYLFLFFVYLGLFLSFFNLDLFTAFLWLTECVIVFISILFLFYLNVYGNQNKNNLIIQSFKYFSIFLLLLIFLINFDNSYLNEILLNKNFNNFIFWDDYYESLHNSKMNDLYSLYISYYYLNSIEFILVGFLLLVASLICVNINKINKNVKTSNYYDLLALFDFFEDFTKFIFMRKQNLTDQATTSTSTRIFKKKVSK